MSTPIPAEPVLDSAGMRLRPLRPDDADDLYALHSDTRVMRYWSTPAWTQREQAAERIAKFARDRETSEFYTFAVTIDGADRLVGTVSLFAISREHRRAEIGYALASELWGRGIATRMLRVAIEFAFGELDLWRLEADIDPRNEASCRLVERVGFVREGLLRERWRVAGEVTDSAMYGLVRTDWNPSNTL